MVKREGRGPVSHGGEEIVVRPEGGRGGRIIPTWGGREGMGERPFLSSKRPRVSSSRKIHDLERGGGPLSTGRKKGAITYSFLGEKGEEAHLSF